MCSKPRGARGIDPETLPKEGSAFITSSDHWTKIVQACWLGRAFMF